MGNKGFTLVEVLAVITVLLIIMLISFPKINDMIKDNEDDQYKQAINNIVLAAETFNGNYNNKVVQVPVVVLKSSNYLTGTITNPKTNTEMNGCVYISGSTYNYVEESCDLLMNN